MRSASTLLAIAALGAVSAENITKPTFEATTITAPFLEQFTDDWTERWTPSEATKKTPVGGETFSYVGQWAVEESIHLPAINGDKGLVAKSKAAHHAISAPLAKPLDPAGKTLVVQYEAKFQKGGNCGGGYVKLLEDGYQSKGQEFSDKTPWVVMFGPDLTCPGTKVHFIFRHQNPVSKEFEEKHLSSPPMPQIGDATVLYTLIVKPDNTYEILIDDESVSTGSLLENFTPPVNPSKEIDDPEDSKPSTWVDLETIPDPEAHKPLDWDEDAPFEIPDLEAEKPEDWLDEEPFVVPDPDAEKPEEWDDEEDGDWIAPTIPNPKCESVSGCGPWVRPSKTNPDYKGKWSAPQIPNPEYKGVWAPRKIANPTYFEDLHPANLNKIGGLGFEIWSMTEDILFDNIYIGHSVADAKKLAAETFHIKKPIETAEAEANKPAADEPASAATSFKDSPLEWIREQVLSFIELVKADPVGAFKTKPETGIAVIAILLTFFGSIGTLFGLVGGSSKPIKSTKKVDVPSTAEKKAVAADAAASVPTVPATAESSAVDEKSGAKKRAGK